MSGTLRGRRRAIPANLLNVAAPRQTLIPLTPRLLPATPNGPRSAALLSARHLLTPRTPQPTGLVPPPAAGASQPQVTGLPTPPATPQATALPTPVRTTLMTIFTTVSAAPSPTGASQQDPQRVEGAPSLAATGAALAGAGAAPTGPAEANASIQGPAGANGLLIGISGAAGFSLLGVAGFFIARRRRQSGADMKLNRVKKGPSRNTLDATRAQAMAGQLPRPYSSRFWLG